MKGFQIIILSGFLFILASCDNNQRKTTMSPAELPELSLDKNNMTTTSARLNPAHGQPGHRCDIAVGAPLDSKPAAQPGIVTNPVITSNQSTVQPTAQSSAQGLNPAHGQPGHRCDIPVGSPLNSKPAAQPGITSSSTSVPVTIAQSPSQQVAPGMNPAHGQPGHRCDIAVGAPLNSKPNPVQVQQPAVPLLPIKPDSSGR